MLEDRGWIIHRIWSTDWFQRPENELRKAIEAIEQAKVVWAGRDVGDNLRPTITLMDPAQNTRRSANGAEPHTPSRNVVPYQVASLRITTSGNIDELPRIELATIIARIIGDEGPIHRDEIARRVTQLWGPQFSDRVCAAVEATLAEMAEQGQCVQEREVYALGDVERTPIRDWNGVDGQP